MESDGNFSDRTQETNESPKKETNFAFLIFYSILFMIIFITDLVYFNAPSRKVDYYLEDSNIHGHSHIQSSEFNNFQVIKEYDTDKPGLAPKSQNSKTITCNRLNLLDNNSSQHTYYLNDYKVVSKYSKDNYIKCELKLINNFKNEFLYNNLSVFFSFDVDKINVRIFQQQEIEPGGLDYKDYKDLNNLLNPWNSNLNNLEHSNLAVKIFNYPFDFVIYRKDLGSEKEKLEIIYDTRKLNKTDTTLKNFIYSKNERIFSSKIPLGLYSYGLGEDFGDLRLKNNFVYSLIQNSSLKNLDEKKNISGYSALPVLLNINPISMNPYGLVIRNSGHIKIIIKDERIYISQNSGIIDFSLFLGKSPKEIIEGVQNTYGLPILPNFYNLNWQVLNNLNPSTCSGGYSYCAINYVNQFHNDTNNINSKIITSNYNYDYTNSISLLLNRIDVGLIASKIFLILLI